MLYRVLQKIIAAVTFLCIFSCSRNGEEYYYNTQNTNKNYDYATPQPSYPQRTTYQQAPYVQPQYAPRQTYQQPYNPYYPAPYSRYHANPYDSSYTPTYDADYYYQAPTRYKNVEYSTPTRVNNSGNRSIDFR